MYKYALSLSNSGASVHRFRCPAYISVQAGDLVLVESSNAAGVSIHKVHEVQEVADPVMAECKEVIQVVDMTIYQRTKVIRDELARLEEARHRSRTELMNEIFIEDMLCERFPQYEELVNKINRLKGML